VLEGQVDYNARLGVTWSSPLLRDRIVSEIEVQPKLAPTLVLGASLPIAPRYQAGLEVALTTSGYRAEEAGVATDVGTLRTGSVTLGLHGPIAAGLRWRAGAGLLSYWPAEDQGMFLRGGTTKFLAGAGADYRRAILPHWELMASLGYDFHRFNTEELEARGFSRSRGIHRIAVTVGLGRAAR
jgi:preprotein translocase subunit Sec61beta